MSALLEEVDFCLDSKDCKGCIHEKDGKVFVTCTCVMEEVKKALESLYSARLDTVNEFIETAVKLSDTVGTMEEGEFGRFMKIMVRTKRELQDRAFIQTPE